MLYTDAIGSLKTRSEVRAFLSKELGELIGGQLQQDLPLELADLATGSDREVIETSRRLDKLVEARSTVDAGGPDTAMQLQIRDLFAKALQRMKQLPPDPRATLHAKPLPSNEVARAGFLRRKRK
jgi:hypothetical protein